MIFTLLFTIIVETFIVLGYCIWRRKPIRPLLITSICVNLITQSLLWLVLNIFFRNYLVTLLVAEILIWFVESIMLASMRANALRYTEALSLSLIMNLSSFALGWFLPL